MKIRNYLLLSASCLLLSNCDSIKSTLGLDHYQADEFMVSTNPPLEMPPSYQLRPPRTGGSAKEGQTASNKAQKALGDDGTSKEEKKPSNVSEEILVKAKGKNKVNPNIRKTINKEAGVETDTDEKLKEEFTQPEEEIKTIKE